MKNKNKEKGFTLVELLAVIVIIGILTTLAVPAILRYMRPSKDKMNISNASSATTSVLTYYTSNRMKESMIYPLKGSCELEDVTDKNECLEDGYIWQPGISDLLDKKLETSPYGYKYDDSSKVFVEVSNAKRNVYICLIDSEGNAIGKIEEDGTLGLINANEIDKNYKMLKLDKGTKCGEPKIEMKYELLTTLIKGESNQNIIGTLSQTSLSKSYEEAKDKSGLYVSTDTNDGSPTYYFRGNNGCNGVVMTKNLCTLLGGTRFDSSNLLCLNNSKGKYYYTNELTSKQCGSNNGTYDESAINNYVSFAGLMWRVVRINEDGTTRMILNDTINIQNFNSKQDEFSYMYYSNSDVDGGIKRTVDTWYNNNLKDYEERIAISKFCENYKVTWTSGPNANVETELFENYISTFKCSTDANGKGILNLKIGLLTFDELEYAGNYAYRYSGTYLIPKNNRTITLMSPAGIMDHTLYGLDSDIAMEWVYGNGLIGYNELTDIKLTSPVISLKADTLAVGTGTRDDPYIIK